MPSLTIRNLDEELTSRLRDRAARHGRSVEDEVRAILRTALSQRRRRPANLAAAICARFAPIGGVDLPPIEREALRDPPEFDA